MHLDEEHVVFKVLDTDIVGITIFSIAIIGVIANSIVAFFTAKLPTMNNPFGRLTASQATGEAILCAVFAFYFGPMVFFPRNTKVFIVVSWTIPTVTAVVLYKFFDCDLFYSSDLWAFVFSQNDVCNFISWNIDFYKDISIVIVIASLDIVTIFNVHKMNVSGTVTSHMQRARRRREVNFLKQAVLQGIVFTVELLTYFIFAWKFQSKWAIWSLTSLAWVLVHTTDGMIIILFNREFRGLVTRPLRKLHSVADGGSSISHSTRNGNGTSAVHPATLCNDSQEN